MNMEPFTPKSLNQIQPKLVVTKNDYSSGSLAASVKYVEVKWKYVEIIASPMGSYLWSLLPLLSHYCQNTEESPGTKNTKGKEAPVSGCVS